MSVLLAKEGETTWLSGIRFEDLPYDLPPGIQILNKSGMVGLRVDGIVGALALRDGRTLRISPKIGEANFFAMFFRAEGQMDEIERELQQLVEYSTSSDRSVEAFVARSLIFSADEIMRRSPLVGRTPEVKASRSALGAIDPAATVARLKSGSDQPVISRAKTRTVNIPENRLISMALKSAIGFLAYEDQARLLGIVQRWTERFPTSSDLRQDLQKVELGLARNQYGGPRGYYQKALAASLIILGASGISVSGSNPVLGESVLINTADIYEKYLRNTIRKVYSDKGYLVTKTGIDGTSLYTNGSYALEPDIVVYKENKLVLLCDAKYKSPTSADHYQMQTYLKRFDLRSGILLCPNFGSEKVDERQFQTPEKTIVREVYLPMHDLIATEQYLSSIIQKFSEV
tara:strand:- start:2156 stop:3361 length:1206 start_codon:yes stop_codon:yes gene_type:complete